jgi:hypothetical protein
MMLAEGAFFLTMLIERGFRATLLAGACPMISS